MEKARLTNQQPIPMEQNYSNRRKRASGLLYESALPNEYLVKIGQKTLKPVLGGRMFKLGRKFQHIPASVQKLRFSTDNANQDFQGIGIEGYATWRINPEKPEIAISTLDFFDDVDPMARTNQDLTTICIEAVRHVISNMSIEDALKNKDEIAKRLTKELKNVEEKWGILFDQVGIEQVRIMSNRLFTDLQAKYRSQTRLNAEKVQIETNRQISKEETETQEKIELEKLESRERLELETLQTEEKLRLREIEKNKQLQRKDAENQREIKLVQQKHTQEDFQHELDFKIEKEREEHRYKELQHELQVQLLSKKNELLEAQLKVQELDNEIGKKKLELEKLQRELSQTFTKEALEYNLMNRLPDMLKQLKIENYSVIDNSGEGVSPLNKLVQDIISLLRTNNLVRGIGEEEY